MKIYQGKYENIYLQKDHLGANTSFCQNLRQEDIWVLWVVSTAEAFNASTAGEQR